MNNKLKTTDGNVVKGSIQDVANQTGQSMADAMLGAQYVAIIDISISMDTRDAKGEGSLSIRRFDAAVQALNSLQGSMPGQWIIIEFSSTHQIVPSGAIHSPNGFTNLAGALEFAKQFNGMGLKFYLISDGEPDSKSAALNVARTWQDKLDVICVGGATGSEFMRELAAVTGGIQTDLNEFSPKALESTLKLLCS